MSVITIGLIVVVIAGALAALYAWRAPRRETQPLPEPRAPLAPLATSTAWTDQAGSDFGALSESARCELVFAVAALDDERSRELLVHALDDPSETVALAAAHALASRGRANAVEAYLAQHPGDRAGRIAQTLTLLARPSDER